MQSQTKPKNFLDYFFDVGVVLKGIDGILEIIGGFIFIFIHPTTINNAVIWLTQRELAEDPHDIIANWLVSFSQSSLFSAKIFAALYLFSHGFIKIGLVIALLKNKLWSYPAAIVFLLVFIFYQVYRLTLNFSVALLLLTIFDAVVIWLVWYEYVKVKNRED